jgi:hypothetical protein
MRAMTDGANWDFDAELRKVISTVNRASSADARMRVSPRSVPEKLADALYAASDVFEEQEQICRDYSTGSGRSELLMYKNQSAQYRTICRALRAAAAQLDKS